MPVSHYEDLVKERPCLRSPWTEIAWCPGKALKMSTFEIDAPFVPSLALRVKTTKCVPQNDHTFSAEAANAPFHCRSYKLMYLKKDQAWQHLEPLVSNYSSFQKFLRHA